MHDLKISHNIHKDEKRGTYYFRITYYDETNKRKEIKRSGFKMRKEAVLECNKYIDELEGIGKINKLPFTELAEEYLDWYSARRKASSIKALRTHLNNHLIPYFKNVDVFDMDTKMIMKFQSKKLKEGLSGNYLKSTHVFLVQMLNHAVKYHGLDKNVASLVGNFEVESVKRLNYWTLDQFNIFIEAVPTLQQKMFFTLLFWSGARKGEIRALTWNDINFDENYIRIDKTDYHGKVTTTKTKSSTRNVYLVNHVMEDLKEYQVWYKENEIYKDEYVLFGTFHKALSESTIDKWYKSTLDILEDTLPPQDMIPRIVLHEFRHSTASMLINLGATPKVVASMLGHAGVTEVNERYGHLYPSTQLEIIRLLENQFKKYDIEHFSDWNIKIDSKYKLEVSDNKLIFEDNGVKSAECVFTLDHAGTPTIDYSIAYKDDISISFSNYKKTISLLQTS